MYTKLLSHLPSILFYFLPSPPSSTLRPETKVGEAVTETDHYRIHCFQGSWPLISCPLVLLSQDEKYKKCARTSGNRFVRVIATREEIRVNYDLTR
jgi:hypothetical protein